MSVPLASIPSPSSGNIHVGPLTIHMYGVMLLLGIAAAVGLVLLLIGAIGAHARSHDLSNAAPAVGLLLLTIAAAITRLASS